MSETAAWDYHKSLPEDERFDLMVMNPGLIVGPTFNKETFESQRMITKIMNGKIGRIPDMHIEWVDIRDVADAHIKALTVDAPSGRFILHNGSYTMMEVAEMLSEEFKPLGYGVCTKSLPGAFTYVGSWFSSMAKELHWNRGKR